MKGPGSALAAAWLRRARPAFAAGLLGLACTACHEPAAPPEAPAGAAFAADRAQLGALLGALAELEGTPLGRHSKQLGATLPDCPVVEAHALEPDLDALAAALRCREAGGELEALHASRGQHGMAFVWPLEGSEPLRGWLTLRGDGGVDTRLELPSDAFDGAAALLVPGERDPGAGVLSGEESLLHARVRPGAGLDLARLVPRGGQADRMFRLKSELFRGVVLDGTWEAAVYLPGPGEPSPRAALALGFRQRAAAIAATEAFVAELGSTWSLRRSFFELDGAEGACLLDLRILPGFAPCYVVTGSALVVGYNPPSLRRALSGGSNPALGEAGGLVVELARFAEADARLAATAGSGAPRAASDTVRPPWRRARAEAAADGSAFRVHVELEPRGDT